MLNLKQTAMELYEFENNPLSSEPRGFTNLGRVLNVGGLFHKTIKTMTRFYFRIYQNGDPDGDNIWVDAMTESEARREVEHEYWGIDNLILLRTEKL